MERNLLRHIYKPPSSCLSEGEIRAYLSDKASPEGKRRVENHLLDCPLCSDAVEGFEEATSQGQGTRQPEDFSSFKKKLAPLQAAKIRSMTPRRVLLRAAAAAAILVIGYFTWFWPPSHERLYAQFYTFYENDIPLDRRGAETEGLNPAFENALKHYANGEFEACLPFFQEVLAADPNNDAARFFAGMAGMETGNWDKASGFFSAVKENGGAYADKATWYLSLASLKLRQKEKAKSLLGELIASGGYKKEEAEKLRDWL